jgi:CheY-like chemotaxis protein
VGTTFHVYLPVVRDRALPNLNAEELVGDGSTILVVDDDETQREVALHLLEALGYRVRVACSGQDALRELAREGVDLMVLDLLMPGGLDGTETFRRARERRPGQRAILVTGFPDSDRVAEARQLGIEHVVRRPLTLHSLARAVKLELTRRGSTS